MSTPLLSNTTMGFLRTPTSGSASRKRKAEETLPYPSYPRLKPLAQPAVISSATAPTSPISPISHLQLSPPSSADAFPSRIQQAIDLHFPTSETNAVLPFANDPLMDGGDTIDMSHEIDLGSDCNSSRHESSTRSVTESDLSVTESVLSMAESDLSDTEDISQEILDATNQINETVEARKWLFFIEHHLHKILHGLAQIEGAAVQVARTTNSAVVFSDSIYHLKEQVMLLHLCQQHKVEESYGEQALLKSKVRELRELSGAQVSGMSSCYHHSICRPPEEINTSICRALFRG